MPSASAVTVPDLFSFFGKRVNFTLQKVIYYPITLRSAFGQTPPCRFIPSILQDALKTPQCDLPTLGVVRTPNLVTEHVGIPSRLRFWDTFDNRQGQLQIRFLFAFTETSASASTLSVLARTAGLLGAAIRLICCNVSLLVKCC